MFRDQGVVEPGPKEHRAPFFVFALPAASRSTCPPALRQPSPPAQRSSEPPQTTKTPHGHRCISAPACKSLPCGVRSSLPVYPRQRRLSHCWVIAKKREGRSPSLRYQMTFMSRMSASRTLSWASAQHKASSSFVLFISSSLCYQSKRPS